MVLLSNITDSPVSDLADQHVQDADFHALDLTGHTFENQTFTSVAFHRCNLTNATFRNCSFGLTSFSDCTLNHTEFENCTGHYGFDTSLEPIQPLQVTRPELEAGQ